MDFLVEYNFVYCDLVVWNVYVVEDNIVKIFNFGIGSYKYLGDYFWVYSSVLFLVWWMVLEVFNVLQFFYWMDVWFYGILLWEFYIFGGQLYVGFSN